MEDKVEGEDVFRDVFASLGSGETLVDPGCDVKKGILDVEGRGRLSELEKRAPGENAEEELRHFRRAVLFVHKGLSGLLTASESLKN